MASNDNQLGALHELLVTQYVKYLAEGGDDPRMLKEVRELLRDNDITGDITDTLKAMNNQSLAELPDDWVIEG